MSAYLCDPETLSGIVSYAVAGCSGLMLKRADAEQLFASLLSENQRSLEYRYGPGNGSPTKWYSAVPLFTFRNVPAPKDDKVIELVKEYVYQACEHPAWKSSPVKRLCDLLVADAQRRIAARPKPPPFVPCPMCSRNVDNTPAGTLEHLAACEVGDTSLDRDTAIARIRAALKKRSGKAWSVKGGRGTSWGWISVSAPPRRLVNGRMTGEDSAELARLLGVDRGGHVSIPASSDYYAEYVARAEGREPTIYGKVYWD